MARRVQTFIDGITSTNGPKKPKGLKTTVTNVKTLYPLHSYIKLNGQQHGGGTCPRDRRQVKNFFHGRKNSVITILRHHATAMLLVLITNIVCFVSRKLRYFQQMKYDLCFIRRLVVFTMVKQKRKNDCRERPCVAYTQYTDAIFFESDEPQSSDSVYTCTSKTN